MTPTHSVRCSESGCLPAQTNQSKASPRQPGRGSRTFGRLEGCAGHSPGAHSGSTRRRRKQVQSELKTITRLTSLFIHYSPNLVEGEFSEVRLQDAA